MCECPFIEETEIVILQMTSSDEEDNLPLVRRAIEGKFKACCLVLFMTIWTGTGSKRFFPSVIILSVCYMQVLYMKLEQELRIC